jgi:ribosomal protein S8E
VPTGKNHGLVMFIDWSGSMTTCISGLIEQLVNMVLFCKRVQIPFDVYAFSNVYGNMNLSAEEIGVIEERQHSYKNGDLLVNSSLSLLQLLSSSMKEGEFNLAIGNLLSLCKIFRNTAITVDTRPFGFGSTPLDSTIICATSIVNAFRSKHKLQIVNTVILTDGEDTDDIEIKNVKYNPYNQNLVLRDTVTKSEAVIENVWDTSATTAIFLNRLRDRTGTNVIGYYLKSGRVNSMSFCNYSADPTEVEKLYQNYTKNRYIEVTNQGYSVYYIIKAEEMNIQNAELNLGKATTAKSIAKVFAKYSKNKLDNRVVLSRFIEKISA